ncbi:hypothetical protein LTR09_005828 [Extremus antarcticus]|uniref:DUF7702 domain-containing protein n=1 Tax=Extremus antarcticus TaxID=702011 RepID=A0AAJ0DMS0_9PEZI|nr:hypothetical protein LTR09_005828 [Extremus antarcticus]
MEKRLQFGHSWEKAILQYPAELLDITKGKAAPHQRQHHTKGSTTSKASPHRHHHTEGTTPPESQPRMAPPTPDAALAAAEVAFYATTLLVSLFYFLCYQSPRYWRSYGFLALFCLIQLVSASIVLGSGSQVAASQVFSGCGTGVILMVLVGFLFNLDDSLERTAKILSDVLAIFVLSLMFGLFFTFVGSVVLADPRRHDSKSTEQDYGCVEAGSVLLLITYGGLAYFAARLYQHKHNMVQEGRKLANTVAVALPFLLIPIIHAMSMAFSRAASIFQYRHVNIYVSAFMRFLPEAVVVILFLSAGPMRQEATSQRGDPEEAPGRAPVHETGANEAPNIEAVHCPSPSPPSYQRREPPPPYQQQPSALQQWGYPQAS